MDRNIQVGIRCCGGCNPRFDRVALVKQLAGRFPQIEFLPAEPGVPYPAVLVVCGCSAQCAGTAGLNVPDGGLLTIRDAEASLARAEAALACLHTAPEGQPAAALPPMGKHGIL